MACVSCSAGSSSCSGGCNTGCTSCQTCTGGCRDTGGCGGTCQGSCSTTCASYGGCTGTCKGECTGCSGNCSGSCKGGCTNSCGSGCGGTCSSACNSGCKNGNYDKVTLSLTEYFEAENIQLISDYIKYEATKRSQTPVSITFPQGELLDDSKINNIITNLSKSGQTMSNKATAGNIALRELGLELINKAKAAHNTIVPIA